MASPQLADVGRQMEQPRLRGPDRPGAAASGGTTKAERRDP